MKWMIPTAEIYLFSAGNPTDVSSSDGLTVGDGQNEGSEDF